MPLCTDCIITISDPPLCRATVEQKYGSVVWILLNNICGKKPGCPGGFMPCSYFSCAAIWQVEDPGILWWVVYEQGSESPFIFWVIRGELFCWGWGLGGGGSRGGSFRLHAMNLWFCAFAMLWSKGSGSFTVLFVDIDVGFHFPGDLSCVCE